MLNWNKQTPFQKSAKIVTGCGVRGIYEVFAKDGGFAARIVFHGRENEAATEIFGNELNMRRAVVRAEAYDGMKLYALVTPSFGPSFGPSFAFNAVDDADADSKVWNWCHYHSFHKGDGYRAEEIREMTPEYSRLRIEDSWVRK
jgi:hypothetical protein